MLTDPKLRSQVDQLWDKLWTGGLTNPLDAIEQLSYLIFLKRLDDEEDRRERQAQRRGQPYQPRLPEDKRWRYWTHFQATQAPGRTNPDLTGFRNLSGLNASPRPAAGLGAAGGVSVPAVITSGVSGGGVVDGHSPHPAHRGFQPVGG